MKDFGDKQYVCADCAHLEGAIWPEGHCATFNDWHCDWCDKKTNVCHVRNYNWRQDDSKHTYTTSSKIQTGPKLISKTKRSSVTNTKT